MATKYSKWNRGQEEALLNKLGGQEVAERLLRCNSVKVTFSDGKAEIMACDLLTSIWKPITIGNISRNKFTPMLKKRGTKVSDRAVRIMKQDALTVVDKEEIIDLVNVSVAELGFDTATRYDVICQRAKELGLDLCPAETGPQLRIQYLDQPLGEVLVIAMEAIRDSDGVLSVFYVEHDDDGLWLRSFYGRPDILWNPDCRFVFRAPAVATSFAKATAVKKAMAGRRKQPSDT